MEKSVEELRAELDDLKPTLREALQERNRTWDVYYTQAVKTQRLVEKYKKLDRQLAEAEGKVVLLRPGQSGRKKGGVSEKSPQEQLGVLLKGMTKEQQMELVRNLLATK